MSPSGFLWFQNNKCHIYLCKCMRYLDSSRTLILGDKSSQTPGMDDCSLSFYLSLAQFCFSLSRQMKLLPLLLLLELNLQCPSAHAELTIWGPLTCLS